MESTTSATTRRRVKMTDVIFSAIILIIVIVLAAVLFRQLGLKHEISAATTVTNRVVNDIKTVNAKDVRSLGDSKFQANHSQAALQTLFQQANHYATGTPVLERKTILHGTQTDSVANIYKYNTGKQVFYIRVTVTREAGSWKVVGISGNSSITPLLKN